MASQLMGGEAVLIRCDASWRVGFGHLVRCLAVAEELRDSHGCTVTFALREDAEAAKRVEAHGFAVRMPEMGRPFQYDAWLAELVTVVQPRALILDVRDDLSLQSVRTMRERGVSIVVLDDAHERRLAADLVFYPPVPQIASLDWVGFIGTVHTGWEWVVLRGQFAGLPRKSVGSSLRVLVTMGGSDPAGLTIRAVDALMHCNAEFSVTVVVGPGYASRETLERRLDQLGQPFDIVGNVEDMATLMMHSDLAIATFGVTAYELAAAGTPAILLCLDADHVASVRALTEAGAAISLGLHGEVSDRRLTTATEALLADGGLRQLMAARGQVLIDGCGARRVAALVKTELKGATR